MKRAAIVVLIGLALVYSVGAWLMFTAGRANATQWGTNYPIATARDAVTAALTGEES